MTPDPVETLTCVLENLEELVFPQLVEQHAASVARSTSILLRHLILRLRDEPALLAADIQEKRALAAELSARLGGARYGEVLTAFATEFAAIAAVEPPPTTSSTAQLTAESTNLKDVVERFVHVLHSHRAELGEPEFRSIQLLVRRQLRAQLDRELTLVSGPLGTSTFPY